MTRGPTETPGAATSTCVVNRAPAAAIATAGGSIAVNSELAASVSGATTGPVVDDISVDVKTGEEEETIPLKEYLRLMLGVGAGTVLTTVCVVPVDPVTP